MYQVSEAWRMHSYPQKPNTTGKERHFHAEDADPATSIEVFQLLGQVQSSPWRSLASVAPEGEVHCRPPGTQSPGHVEGLPSPFLQPSRPFFARINQRQPQQVIASSLSTVGPIFFYSGPHFLLSDSTSSTVSQTVPC
ncbi:hypothetical protein FALCPG4_001089 [Fusarium falciforme]